MEKKEYLNEEKSKKTSKILSFVGFLLLGVVVVALLICFVPMIIGTGGLQKQLDQLRPGLEARYDELEAQGFKPSYDYKDREGFEMTQIDLALNPKYEYCGQTSNYVENNTTREYCNIKSQIYNINKPHARIGGAFFIIIPCLGIGLSLVMAGKQRSMLAYHMQQTMPLAQEGMEKMTPTFTKVGKQVTEEMAPTVAKVGKQVTEEMAPAYGKVAKEIAKGVKEGIVEGEKSKKTDKK